MKIINKTLQIALISFLSMNGIFAGISKEALVAYKQDHVRKEDQSNIYFDSAKNNLELYKTEAKALENAESRGEKSFHMKLVKIIKAIEAGKLVANPTEDVAELTKAELDCAFDISGNNSSELYETLRTEGERIAFENAIKDAIENTPSYDDVLTIEEVAKLINELPQKSKSSRVYGALPSKKTIAVAASVAAGVVAGVYAYNRNPEFKETVDTKVANFTEAIVSRIFGTKSDDSAVDSKKAVDSDEAVENDEEYYS